METSESPALHTSGHKSIIAKKPYLEGKSAPGFYRANIKMEEETKEPQK